MVRYLAGLFALLLCAPGVGLAFDWQTEPDLREIADHSEHGGIILVDIWGPDRKAGGPRGGWVLGDFEPPEDETPTYPPDPHPFPECPEGDVWTCPKGQPFPEGCVCLMWPDGRGAKLIDGGGNIEWISPREADRPPFTVADLFETWGMFDTEDGADDTPTLEDPTEKLIEQIEWRGGVPLQTEGEDPTPRETPTAGQVEETPEPTPAVCPPNTTPTLFGLCLGWWSPFGDWREIEGGGTPCGQQGEEPCPGAPHPQPDPCEPGTRPCASGCCTPIGHQPDGDDGGWDALPPREVPAGYDGPWRYFVFTSATEGR